MRLRTITKESGLLEGHQNSRSYILTINQFLQKEENIKEK